MHVNYVEKGASRYLINEVGPFDQKNEMFKRPMWDPVVMALGKRFYKDHVMPRKSPGYTLKDQALTNAAWLLDSCCYDPGEKGAGTNLYAWDWDGNFNFPRVPSGLKATDMDSAELTGAIKRVAGFFGASLVGTCELDRRWLYSASYFVSAEGGIAASNPVPKEITHAVAIAVEMDYDGIGCSPSNPSSAATGLGYSKMAFAAGLLARFIQGLGYKAIPSGNSTALSIPIAIDAGLGEMARNGLLITPEYGPRVRLAKVLTNAPLKADRPMEFGVRDFCMICSKCARKCPSRAIDTGPPHPEPYNISNQKYVDTWHINAEKCLSFWADNGTDCSNCIRVCPFNKPPGLLHDMVRWGINNVRWLNRAYLWGDDLMGYGRRKNARHFWTCANGNLEQ